MVHLDHLHYPHLVDSILSFITSGPDIAAFRLTSHHFRDRIDSVLARHFVLRTEDELMWMSTRRWGASSPALHHDLRLTHALCTDADRIPMSVMIPPTTFYRSAKILDLDCEDHSDASLCASFQHLEVLRVLFAEGDLPAAPTTVLFWPIGEFTPHRLSLAEVRTLVIRSYSPAASFNELYDDFPLVDWSGHGIIEDLVLIGQISNLSQYATRIAEVIEAADEVKRITVVGCGVDSAEVLVAVEATASRGRIERVFDHGDDPLDAQVGHTTEWLSMTVDEYKKTLSPEEAFLFLDDTKYMGDHEYAAHIRAYGRDDEEPFWWMDNDSEDEAPECCSSCLTRKRKEPLTGKRLAAKQHATMATRL